MSVSNPKEIYLLRHDKTFFIEEALVPIPYWDEKEKRREPELLHHPTFSRFKFGIINAEGKRSVYHINVSELDDIIIRSNFAYNKEMELQMEGASAQSSPAFTARFKAGNLKGLTPAEAIVKNGVDVVAGQRDYLLKQTKYAKQNAPIIAACNEAITLYNNGNLNNVKSVEPFPIYKMDFPFANPYKTKNGLAQVRRINITWNFQMDNPVDINVMECYAPTTKTNTNLEIPDMKQAQFMIDNHFSLTASQWQNAVRNMDRFRERFEDSIWSDHRKAAVKIDKENRENLNNNQNNNMNHTYANNSAPASMNSQPSASGPAAPSPAVSEPGNYKKLKCTLKENRRDPSSGNVYSIAECMQSNGVPRQIAFFYKPGINLSSIPLNKEVIVNLAVSNGKYCCVGLG